MAFSSNIPNSSYGKLHTNAYVVIRSFMELQKDTLVVNVSIWRNKEEYLDKLSVLEDKRFLIDISELTFTSTIREGIYTWLMGNAYFENAIADMSNDFPVSYIE